MQDQTKLMHVAIWILRIFSVIELGGSLWAVLTSNVLLLTIIAIAYCLIPAIRIGRSVWCETFEVARGEEK